MPKATLEFTWEIIRPVGVLGTKKTGWSTELNIVSWSGRTGKYDLRSWSPDHTKMGKGITLSDEEVIALANLLAEEVSDLV